MKNRLTAVLCALCCMVAMAACSDNDTASEVRLVENARLLEEGQTLSPGDVVHLMGSGYLGSDEVVLNFYWATGDAVLPEGSVKGYMAEVQSAASDGLTVRLPHRKPESRVEVVLKRGGDLMTIGEVFVKDGSTPRDARLYGISNSLHDKGVWTDHTAITRYAPDNAGYDTAEWPLDEAYADFHSVVSCWQCYGLCGLSGTHGVQRPVFFDLITSEWKVLSDYPTLALFAYPAGVAALTSIDGEGYTMGVATAGLDKSEDYATASSRSLPPPQPSFPLPQGLEDAQFGSYPGAYTGGQDFLLSADLGDGTWVPVVYSVNQGFHVLDSIKADGLIPFSFMTADNEWRCGYIVASDSATNGTELYLLEKDGSGFPDEPYAVFPNRALSVSANYQQPGSLTVHFLASRNGNLTYRFTAATKEWESLFGGYTFSEIVWTN